jgi:hypothetical protein
MEFTFDVLEIDESTIVNKKLEKKVYNTDNKKSLSDWMSSFSSEKENVEFPKFSSPLNIKETKWGSELKGSAFATLVSNSNNIEKNENSVYIVNGGITLNLGKYFLTKENLLTVLVGFVARKSIIGDWTTQKDEYLAPDESNPNFEQFKNDSLIYSLFHIHSFQSSLRQVNYKEKLWDIKNQFFWMSKEEMMNLANQNNYTEMYNDVRTDSDRYVYNLLFGEQRIYDQLSTQAKDVLDTATELVRLSIGMRRNFADGTNHLNSWDAGYAQLKLLWKEYFPEQFKEFRNKYKVLEDKMRPMVYELGFLMK